MITQEQINKKLKEVEEFEEKYGPNYITESWRKWCTDEAYRNNEIKFRESVARSIENLQS